MQGENNTKGYSVVYISQRYSYLNACPISQEFYQVQANHRHHSLRSTPQAGINHLLRNWTTIWIII